MASEMEHFGFIGGALNMCNDWFRKESVTGCFKIHLHVICCWRCCVVKQLLKRWLTEMPLWFTIIGTWNTGIPTQVSQWGLLAFIHTVNTLEALWLALTPEIKLLFFFSVASSVIICANIWCLSLPFFSLSFILNVKSKNDCAVLSWRFSCRLSDKFLCIISKMLDLKKISLSDSLWNCPTFSLTLYIWVLLRWSLWEFNREH